MVTVLREKPVTWLHNANQTIRDYTREGIHRPSLRHGAPIDVIIQLIGVIGINGGGKSSGGSLGASIESYFHHLDYLP